MHMKKQKGFTLAELLVSIGLFSIIFSLIMSIFIANFKNYKSIKNDTELQFQAQYILNFMSDKIIESKYIELAKYNMISQLKKTNEQEITKISFRYGDDSTKCYNFEIINNKIFYGDGPVVTSANVELGDYVCQMFACPIPEGTVFDSADAIKIKIKLRKDSQNYEAEQIMYMRNN